MFSDCLIHIWLWLFCIALEGCSKMVLGASLEDHGSVCSFTFRESLAVPCLSFLSITVPHRKKDTERQLTVVSYLLLGKAPWAQE